MKKCLLAVIFVLVILSVSGCSSRDKAQDNNKAVYAGNNLHIQITYNKSWKKVNSSNSIYLYKGKDGFFYVSGYFGNHSTLNQVVSDEISKSYKGLKTKIINMNVDGQKAKIIEPSAKSSASNNVSEMIIKYPSSINVKNQFKYPNSIVLTGKENYYFILHSDTEHISQLSKTVKFVK
jgi:hypothetical protein